MERILLDPTSEASPAMRERRAPPDSIDGITVGLLDIGKRRSDEFLNYVEIRLAERGLAVKRYAKLTNAKVAPETVKQAIAAECDVVVEGLADWGSCTSCSLHDIADLDGRGIPGGFVLTTAFESAAKTQSEAIGFNPGLVYVTHPIQDRTADELKAIADDAIDGIIRMIGGK